MMEALAFTKHYSFKNKIVIFADCISNCPSEGSEMAASKFKIADL